MWKCNTTLTTPTTPTTPTTSTLSASRWLTRIDQEGEGLQIAPLLHARTESPIQTGPGVVLAIGLGTIPWHRLHRQQVMMLLLMDKVREIYINSALY